MSSNHRPWFVGVVQANSGWQVALGCDGGRGGGTFIEFGSRQEALQFIQLFEAADRWSLPDHVLLHPISDRAALSNTQWTWAINTVGRAAELLGTTAHAQVAMCTGSTALIKALLEVVERATHVRL